MKQHLLILAKLPNAGEFIAFQSLFPWECHLGCGDTTGLRTLEVQGEPNKREMYLDDLPEPILRANTKGDDIEITCNSNVALPDAVGFLMSALGLQEQGRKAGEIIMNPLDVEQLHSRICTLDNAWVLLNRLRKLDSNPDWLQQATLAILQFAQAWSNHCADVCSKGETPSSRKKTEQLEIQASHYPEWNVPGLKGLTLNYDPRGSAFTLLFENTHSQDVCACRMDWPVGQPLQQTAEPPKAKPGKYDVRPTKIPGDVQSVLKGLVVNGCKVQITERLAPRLYAKVNELLVTLGGKWVTSQQAHVFAENPMPLLDALILSGEVYTAKDYEYFATTPPLTSQVITAADIKPGMEILEPNGGGGALAMAAAEIVGKSNVTCYELMPQNVKTLTALGFQLEGPQDFLKIKPEPRFDRVVMNPPFSGGKDIAHIRHAMEFLKPGGVLTAIASTQWQTHDTAPAKAFQAYVASLGGRVKQIPAGAFKASGTDVATTLLVLKKPSTVQKQPSTQKAATTAELQAELF